MIVFGKVNPKYGMNFFFMGFFLWARIKKKACKFCEYSLKLLTLQPRTIYIHSTKIQKTVSKGIVC